MPNEENKLEYNGLVYTEELVPRTETTHLVIHHSAGSFADPHAIHSWHLNRGFAGGGYHYVVSNGYPNYQLYLAKQRYGLGMVWSMRPPEMCGAQAKGFNKRSIGICVIGHYDQEYPLLHCWNAAVRLAYDLTVTYQIPIENIIGHFETYPLRGKPVAKSCPGNLWDMQLFRGHVSHLMKTGGVLNPWEQYQKDLVITEGTVLPTIKDRIQMDIEMIQASAEQAAREAKGQETVGKIDDRKEDTVELAARPWAQPHMEELLRWLRELVRKWKRRLSERWGS